jgi:hypothetical protein
LLDDDVAVENDVEDTKNLMFFDFECTQDDGKHVSNLCVVQNESGDEKVFSGLPSLISLTVLRTKTTWVLFLTRISTILMA